MIDLPDNYAAKEAMAGQLVGTNPTRTVGENIRSRIQQHHDAIEKLEKVYRTLETGNFLNVNLSDLQKAMRW